MGDPLKPAEPTATGRWKLWHLVVLVLLSAPVFGAVRALATGVNGAMDGIYAPVVLGFAGLAPLAMIRGGRKYLGPATSALKSWGVRHGGLIGFLTWLITLAAEVVYYAGSIVVGPVAAIMILVWLARVAGR